MSDSLPPSLDALDVTNQRLVGLLRDNARMTATALGKVLGISRTAVQDRIIRLERLGVIAGYTIVLHPDIEAGMHKAILLIMIEVRPCEPVLRKIRRLPDITICYSVSGAIDAIAIARVRSSTGVSVLIDDIAAIDGVGSVQSSMVLAEG